VLPAAVLDRLLRLTHTRASALAKARPAPH
jgi:hypothetical protein